MPWRYKYHEWNSPWKLFIAQSQSSWSLTFSYTGPLFACQRVTQDLFIYPWPILDSTPKVLWLWCGAAIGWGRHAAKPHLVAMKTTWYKADIKASHIHAFLPKNLHEGWNRRALRYVRNKRSLIWRFLFGAGIITAAAEPFWFGAEGITHAFDSNFLVGEHASPPLWRNSCVHETLFRQNYASKWLLWACARRLIYAQIVFCTAYFMWKTTQKSVIFSRKTKI